MGGYAGCTWCCGICRGGTEIAAGAFAVIEVAVTVVAVEVVADPPESSRAPLAVVALEVVLALPGDPADLRSRSNEISTAAAGAGNAASTNIRRSWSEKC
jgi:hypothetical protein